LPFRVRRAGRLDGDLTPATIHNASHCGTDVVAPGRKGRLRCATRPDLVLEDVDAEVELHVAALVYIAVARDYLDIGGDPGFVYKSAVRREPLGDAHEHGASVRQFAGNVYRRLAEALFPDDCCAAVIVQSR